MFLLELKKNSDNIAFKNEAISIEFTQEIGDRKSCCWFDINERDIFLYNHGQKLFKEHPLKNDYFVGIKQEIKLSKEEIDRLLTPIKCL